MKIGHNLLMVSLLTHRPDTLAFVAVIGLLATCGSVKAAPLRIMPLGDSITAGYTDNPHWTVDFEFGYRSGLYTRLTKAGYDFTFVGGSPEPWVSKYGNPTRGGASLVRSAEIASQTPGGSTICTATCMNGVSTQ